MSIGTDDEILILAACDEPIPPSHRARGLLPPGVHGCRVWHVKAPNYKRIHVARNAASHRPKNNRALSSLRCPLVEPYLIDPRLHSSELKMEPVDGGCRP